MSIENFTKGYLSMVRSLDTLRGSWAAKLERISAFSLLSRIYQQASLQSKSDCSPKTRHAMPNESSQHFPQEPCAETQFFCDDYLSRI
ncbi:hypothetical protein AVEN_159485-1 [Araneus ventricosus]|uniref:Uncharacterized protein n=1 Tax=Araneus ventricosus TaxID=182803 RepID=A0A4Y2A120_ARAVE|nr:hypothetical protein AVEN_159485-1 [Araneus ventricosus]